MARNDEFKAGVELYTGRKVAKLEVFEDPKCTAFALQATFEDGDGCQFLLRTRSCDHELVADDLAEVHYNTWPPKSL